MRSLLKIFSAGFATAVTVFHPTENRYIHHHNLSWCECWKLSKFPATSQTPCDIGLLALFCNFLRLDAQPNRFAQTLVVAFNNYRASSQRLDYHPISAKGGRARYTSPSPIDFFDLTKKKRKLTKSLLFGEVDPTVK